MEACSLLDLLECELDLALVVPVEQQPFARLDDEHGRASLLAVGPAKDAVTARAHIELDVVREPLLELVGIGQGLPDLLGRLREDDLACDFHGSSNPQPVGCGY